MTTDGGPGVGQPAAPTTLPDAQPYQAPLSGRFDWL